MALAATSRNVFHGHKMRRLRRERGLTQAQMADALGISSSYLNLLENNTVSFRLTGRLTADVVEALPAWEGVDGEQCAALQEAAAKRLARLGDTTGAAIVRLGKTRMWVHMNEPELAHACFRESERHWPMLAADANLAAARAWLESEFGETLAPAARTRLRRLLLPIRRRLRRAGLS